MYFAFSCLHFLIESRKIDTEPAANHIQRIINETTNTCENISDASFRENTVAKWELSQNVCFTQ